MRLLCLFNAGAGGRDGRHQVLADLLPKRPQTRLVVTQSVAHMEQEIAAFAPRGEDLIAIHGGDGSLQAMLTVLARTAEAGAPLPCLAILPGGSTNMSARDINHHHGWKSAAAALARGAQDLANAPRARRPVLRAHDPAGLQAGFFLGAGAVVEGIDYCNRRLWAQGAARREGTAGLAMARTILGVLRAEAPFDEPVRLALAAHTGDGEVIRLAPAGGATMLAVSTLDRLLVGARPHWGQESGALRFTMVDRSASVLRHLAGLLGLPGMGRPGPAAGFHSHNCARLELSFGGEQAAATASYAIDGEVLAAPPTTLVLDADWAPEFLLL